MYARGLARRTVEDRIEVMSRVPNALKLTPVTIDAFIDRPGLSAGSRKFYHSVLRSWCKWLVLTGKRPDDPTILAPAPKAPKHQPRPLLDEHVHALLTRPQMRRRTRAMILLGLQAGLRVAEIASIRGDYFDHVGGVLIITGKGSKERDIPIHPDLTDLAKVMPRRGRWFLSPTGNANGPAGSPILPRTISTTVSKVMRRAGLPPRFTAHSLRHTFATRLIRAGVGVEKVQKLLGHESLATTEVYVGLDFPQLRSAVNQLPRVPTHWREVDTAFPYERR